MRRSSLTPHPVLYNHQQQNSQSKLRFELVLLGNLEIVICTTVLIAIGCLELVERAQYELSWCGFNHKLNINISLIPRPLISEGLEDLVTCSDVTGGGHGNGLE